ncbi:MAG: hypothetical protein JXR70_15755 [Spirochaetales bacterium]|nr:hypothetical protein [Spirochaetales bacterium]
MYFQKNHFRILIIIMIVLLFSSCIAIKYVENNAPPEKKEGGVINAELIIKKNFYDLKHSSGKIYHLKGLSQEQRLKLDKLKGQIIKVEIEVIAEINGIERNAKLVRIF